MKNFVVAGILAGTLAFSGAAMATEVMGMGTPNAEQFRDQVASANAYEIIAGNIAESHANSAAIKEFGRKMAKDHTAANDKLAEISGLNKTQFNERLQPGADGKFKSSALLSTTAVAELNSLNSKSNRDFEKTYITDQVERHKETVALLEDYAKDGDSARLKAFATEILPVVRGHHAEAEKIRANLEK